MKWQRPEHGWVKVNNDSAFSPGNCSGSVGVVILDQLGNVVSAAARWFDDVPDVLTAEALAARERGRTQRVVWEGHGKP